MDSLYKQLIRSSVSGTLILFALLFIPVGTLNYWQGWVYMVVFIIASAAYSVYLAKHDPALLKRRTEVGISYEKEPAQKIIIFFLYIMCILLVVLSPLDVRFGWSLVPWYASIIGDVLVAISFYIFYLVSKVNTYAAANIRVEEGQKVISTGLYGVVRHPMYLGAILLFIGTPLALGSWWTLLLIPVFLLLLVARILNEEKLLVRDLPGYTEYQKKVTTRLIPFIW
ncbi:putative S-isoprenylcysteine methyltransferase [Legionella steigerwaltii]|uniref:S-isoprenylcysteine methyltransferase n=1 Tax=Legionella steigerwaltii TaxID=460 RepID=A0A378LDG1_9GAMM|nr:isoprenylcysteine carboxylmethyltransferase family protein [Legionella steigerwaltii]KTD78013.1 putative S-isoprenylcysteine methyltransferase [Legionella steigerwaltii]STY24410.1 putative S-isoprenylcysteine methyltransferase [Legionella steigerwaltii]